MKTCLLSILAAIAGTSLGVGLSIAELSREPDATLPSAGGEAPTVASSGSPAAPPGARPEVYVIGGTEFDFGVMEKDETREHTFVFKNIGTASLKLIKGDTTCKCTLSDLERDLLPPGQTANVKLQWTPKSFASEFRQHATIVTTDPQRPSVQLEVIGRVIQSVRPVPEDLVFSNLSAGEARSAEVRVYCYRDSGFDLKFVRFGQEDAAEHFDVEIKPLADEVLAQAPGAKSGARVLVTAKTGLPLGPIRQTLYFTTGLDDKELAIPVGGSVTGDISIVAGSLLNDERKVLMLGAVPRERGGRFPMHLLVKGPHAADVKLSVGEVDPAEALKVSIDMDHPTLINDGAVRLYPLVVEIPPGSPVVNRLGAASEGLHARLGKIVIETTHPQTPQVLLYVQFAVEG